MIHAARPDHVDTLTEWVAEKLAAPSGRQPRHQSGSYQVCCPSHDDRNPSLSVTPGTHEDGAVVIHCHAGCTPTDVLTAAGLDPRDLFVPRPLPAITAPTATVLRIADARPDTPTPPATYTYHDTDGNVIGQVLRGGDKQFRQMRPDDTGQMVYGGFGRHLYNLPAVLARAAEGRTIAVVEGEKDVDRLATVGIAATCNVGGAGKWTPEMSALLEGADVIVLPDNDQPGLDHAADVAVSLLTRHSGTVKIVRLPGLPPKGDVSDWLDTGGTPQQLADLADRTPPVTPEEAALDLTTTDDDSTDDVDPSWQPLDLTGYLDGSYEPPQPAFMARTDGHYLFYPERTHSLFGPPESGKTWIALHACAETLCAQLDVLYIDFENSPGDIVNKLRLLGVPDGRIAAGLHYIQPHRPMSPDDGQTLGTLVTTRPIGVAVIDGVTNVLGLHGLDGNSNADVSVYDRMLPSAIARHGPAVIQVDHTAKHTGDDNRYAIGAQHKLGAITGAAYLVKVDRQTPFAPGVRGVAKLEIAKDRPGTVRGVSNGNDAGTFVLDSTDGDRIESYVEPPDLGPFRPTHYMERVSDWLEQNPDARPSTRELQSEVTGKKDVIAAAAKCLVAEGFVATETGDRGAVFHRLVRSFSEVTPL